MKSLYCASVAVVALTLVAGAQAQNDQAVCQIERAHNALSSNNMDPFTPSYSELSSDQKVEEISKYLGAKGGTYSQTTIKESLAAVQANAELKNGADGWSGRSYSFGH